MIKNLVKKQIGVFSLIVLLVAAISGCVVSFVGINNYSSIYVNQNAYKDANFDFIIPSPGKTQLGDLQAKEFIDDVCPYYASTLNLVVKSETIKSNIYFVDSLNNLKYSPFCESREKQSVQADGHALAFIDQVYAQEYGLKLGDTINIGTKEYKIGKIYLPNSLVTGGSVVICWDDELKTLLNASDSKYSGAWVKSNDLIACDNFLKKDYVPEGRIRKQAENETDQQYNEYLAEFYKNDFYKEVTIISTNKEIANAKIEDAKRSLIIEEIIAIVVVATLVIVGIYCVYFSTNRKKGFKSAIQTNTNNYRLLKTNITLASIACVALGYVVMLGIVVLAKQFCGYILDVELIGNLFIIFGCMVAVALVVVLLLNNALVNKNYRIIKARG